VVLNCSRPSSSLDNKLSEFLASMVKRILCNDTFETKLLPWFVESMLDQIISYLFVGTCGRSQYDDKLPLSSSTE